MLRKHFVIVRHSKDILHLIYHLSLLTIRVSNEMESWLRMGPFKALLAGMQWLNFFISNANLFVNFYVSFIWYILLSFETKIVYNTRKYVSLVLHGFLGEWDFFVVNVVGGESNRRGDFWSTALNRIPKLFTWENYFGSSRKHKDYIQEWPAPIHFHSLLWS